MDSPLVVDLKAVFQSHPGACLVLRPDLSIVDASDEFLRVTLTFREDIRDRALFTVFPDNPNEPESDGASKLNASLQRVLRSGTPDTLPVQRYEVQDRVAENGRWVEKYWASANSPIFAEGKRDIICLLHSARDVTPIVRARRQLEEQLLLEV